MFYWINIVKLSITYRIKMYGIHDGILYLVHTYKNIITD